MRSGKEKHNDARLATCEFFAGVRLSQPIAYFFFCQGTDEPVADDMQRLEQQAQAVAAKDVTAKLKEKVLFVRLDRFLLL